MKKTLFLVMLSMLLFPIAYADTIILKSGKKIETEKAWEEDGQIKYRRYGGILGFPKDLVERIDVPEAIPYTSYRKKAYVSIINKLPPNFNGDNPSDVYKKLKELDKLKRKAAYETTANYKNRLSDIVFSPIITKTYAFKDTNFFNGYDADERILTIHADGEVSRILGSSYSFVGTNAFGAQTRASNSYYDQVKLDIQNEDEMVKVLNNSPDEYSHSLSVNLEPTEAKRIRAHLRLIYICKPTVFKGCKKKEQWECPHTALKIEGEIATFTAPSGEMTFVHIMSVDLLELILYDDSTGQIIKRFGPF